MSISLAELLVAALADRGAQEDDCAELDEILAAALAAARTAWPTVTVEPDRFVRHLAERLPSGQPAAAALQGMRTADLYLACACAGGDPEALRVFDAAYRRDVHAALAGLRLGAAEVDDLAQVLRARFFVGEGGASPKIADYAGRGQLRGWVRAAATRTGLSHIEARRPEVPLDDGLFDHVGSTGDPELDHLKRRYRAEFRRAFEEALASLTRREQMLLAQSFVDELSIDQIGVIHGVHRATAARWIVKAREALLSATRGKLCWLLDVDRFQVNSVSAFIASQLEVGLGHLVKGR